MSALVVRLGNGSVAFLSGGIPDLELEAPAAHHYGLDFEVNANSWCVRLLELFVAEAHQQVRLADPAIANNNELQKQIGLRVAGAHYFRHWVILLMEDLNLKHKSQLGFGHGGLGRSVYFDLLNSHLRIVQLHHFVLRGSFASSRFGWF